MSDWRVMWLRKAISSAPLCTAILSAVVAFSPACGSESAVPEVSEFEVTTSEWTPAAPELPFTATLPIDPRVIRMEPEAHRGEERLCDVTFLAEEQETPEGVRRLVRCKAESGAGWADLHFSEDARSIARFVRVGVRIRVLVAEEPGFSGHPRFDFIASVEAVEVSEAPERPASLGDDWDLIASAEDLDQHTCGVAYVGGIRPLMEPVSNLTHVADVVCSSRGAESWVRMYFPEATRASALRVVRGEVVPARLLDAETRETLPITTLPSVRYEGP